MSFHLSAQDISLEDGHILRAQLADTEGDYQDAELDLDYYIGNNDGSFEWGGENFSHSAEDVSLEIEGDEDNPILRAVLSNTDGDGVSCDLNLSERIGNDNGVLIFVA